MPSKRTLHSELLSDWFAPTTAAVFLAARADDEYRKLVAVKLVQPGLDSRDLLNRFRKERQTLAGLEHPNIVKLLDWNRAKAFWSSPTVRRSYWILESQRF